MRKTTGANRNTEQPRPALALFTIVQSDGATYETESISTAEQFLQSMKSHAVYIQDYRLHLESDRKYITLTGTCPLYSESLKIPQSIYTSYFQELIGSCSDQAGTAIPYTGTGASHPGWL